MDQEATRSLICRAQQGDRAAFDKLVRTFGGRLKSLVRSLLGQRLRGRIEVDDILQETFLRSLDSIEHFTWQGEDSFFRWLARIAEHLIWNAAQKHPRSELALTEDVKDSAVTPMTTMRREERLDRLKACVASLTADQKEVLQLSRIEGLPIKQIAERLSRSPGSVRMILFRALKNLKASFGDTESLHLPNRCLGSEESDHDE